MTIKTGAMPPIKVCQNCFTCMFTRVKLCPCCGHQTYQSKKDKRGPTTRYRIKVGRFEPRRSVTVHAVDDKHAFYLAGLEMDRRTERAGEESPVAWDLDIVERGT